MKAIEILLEHATSGMLTFDNFTKHLQAIKEIEDMQEKVKVQDDLLKQYIKEEFNGVVAEIGEVCKDCDNYLKDRNIYYDGRKVMICNFCKFNNVSYFKEKEEK